MRHTLPVTVLTGFLGSGKTTLINRILGEAHGRRFAVIENEYGEINVDADLLLKDRAETIVQLSNGCVCCTVRGDLANALDDLAIRREAGQIAFDQVLIETTGLADPGPIVRTFMAETALLSKFHLDGVVTLFDAVNGEHSLAESVEAQAQLAYADRLLVTKVDLIDAEPIESLTSLLHMMNGQADIAAMDVRRAPWGEVFEKLLDLRGYQFDRVVFAPAADAPPAANLDPVRHTGEVCSVSFRATGLLDAQLLDAAFAAMKARYGEHLWRIKGVLAIAGMRNRMVVQGVQGLVQITPAAIWRPFEPRLSQLVLIGRRLHADPILQLLDACVIGRQSTAA
ncbi:MAG: CobW family GTP-binding protein [Panacagrimonas sp.]